MWLRYISRETEGLVKPLLVFCACAKRRRTWDQLKLCLCIFNLFCSGASHQWLQTHWMEKPAGVSILKTCWWFCSLLRMFFPLTGFDFYEKKKKQESVPKKKKRPLSSFPCTLYGIFLALRLCLTPFSKPVKSTWWLGLEIRCHGCREQIQIPSLFAIKQEKKKKVLSPLFVHGAARSSR